MTWMNLENIVSEISQIQKESTYLRYPEQSNSLSRKNNGGCCGWGRWE
jgi:hypothetical protein